MSRYLDRLAKLEAARAQREEAALEAQIAAWISETRARPLPADDAKPADWRAGARRAGVDNPDALLGRVVAILLRRPDLSAQLSQAIDARAGAAV